VASLSDYNAGRLHGVWLDANREPEELQASINMMLAASDEDVAEEFAIHDYEEWGPVHLDE
jgi:antirestriction protein